MITVKDLYKSFGENGVLKGISETVEKGEVVVVNEKFGIRLTDVISPSERIKKLR